MNPLRKLALAAVVALTAGTALAGSYSYFLASPNSFTVPHVGYSTFASGTLAAGSGQFCSVCSGCCSMVTAKVTFRHPKKATFTPRVYIAGQLASPDSGNPVIISGGADNGAYVFTFYGQDLGTNPVSVSAELHTSDAADVLINPDPNATQPYILRLEATTPQ